MSSICTRDPGIGCARRRLLGVSKGLQGLLSKVDGGGGGKTFQAEIPTHRVGMASLSSPYS